MGLLASVNLNNYAVVCMRLLIMSYFPNVFPEFQLKSPSRERNGNQKWLIMTYGRYEAVPSCNKTKEIKLPKKIT